MVKREMARRKYITYFQAFTNTHAPVEVLKKNSNPYSEELGVVGLSIGNKAS